MTTADTIPAAASSLARAFANASIGFVASFMGLCGLMMALSGL
jgi:hypothetical protein